MNPEDISTPMDNPVDIGPVISIDSYENLKKKRNAEMIEKERVTSEEEKLKKQAEEQVVMVSII